MSSPPTSERMATATTPWAPLPLKGVVDAFDEWSGDPTLAHEPALRAALGSVLAARDARGAWIRLRVAPLPPLDLGVGSLEAAGGPPPDVGPLPLTADGGRVVLGEAWIDAPGDALPAAQGLLELALDLVWSRAEARAAALRLDALDVATAAIVAELSLDRVLQVIVDRVRPLVGARYAALGILGEHGSIERFLTSGIDEETRLAIGHPPRGLGILGVIVREGKSLRLADLTQDPRAHGFPAGHPPMRTFLGVPVTVEGRPVGNLYLTEKVGGLQFTADDQRLVEMFGRHAGIAIHNARLHQELQHLAVLQERERIGQDLHDGIIQALYAVGLTLEDVAELTKDDPGEAEARVERAIDSIHGAIRDIRNFIFGLRPELLEDVDLRGGLANLADEFRRSTLIDLALDATGPVDIDAEDAVQLLQLAREALSNVARHASATEVRIELGTSDGMLRLVISDNGRGFVPAAVRGPSHRGLANMRARAESLGGTLTMDSTPGGGTRVIFQLPIDPAAGSEETTR